MAIRAVAPRPSPRPRPQAAPARPRLRVVPPNYVSPRARRRRARRLLAAASVLAVLGLLGVASLHVVLTQGQFRLERLDARARQEQDRYERLRLEVAELESPARVVAAAQQRLGMVPPPGVTYLQPKRAASVTRTNPAGAQDWRQVKPHLAEQP